MVPNGRFELCISDYLDGQRTKWRDGDEPLEQKITDFINGLWVASAQLKKWRQQREENIRRREEEKKEYERKLQLIEEEKSKIQNLERKVMSWMKSREIRAFIKTAIKKRGSYEPDSEFGKWVAWASGYADTLDPLK
jgi:hypothetical protein